MKKLGSALVTIVAFLGGAGEVWAVDWDECQRTEFSKLQSDIVIPACSRIIDAGEVSPSDLAEAHYRRGRGHHRKGNLDPTIADYNKAAQQGHAEAQYELGSIHSQGWGEDSWGVPQNYAEAVKWYRKAAEQGDAEAQTNLGKMYATGSGTQHDDAAAAKWFRMAVL